jgi:hypothetical protein
VDEDVRAVSGVNGADEGERERDLERDPDLERIAIAPV